MVFPTHRLITGLAGRHARARRRSPPRCASASTSPSSRAPTSCRPARPPTRARRCSSATSTGTSSTPYRLTLKDQAIADRALADFPEPYRHLDTAIVEALILNGPLGLTEDDISHFNGLGYSRSDARGRRAGAVRRVRRRVLPAGRERRADRRDRGGRREHAAEVHVLRPEGAHGAAFQPLVIIDDDEAGNRNPPIRFPPYASRCASTRRPWTSRRTRAGTDEGPTPQELLAASLASCVAITAEMYATRKGWDVGTLEVECSFTPAERGAPTKFDIVLRLPDHLSDEQVERLRVIAAKCPVHRTLEGEVMFDERVERVTLAS